MSFGHEALPRAWHLPCISSAQEKLMLRALHIAATGMMAQEAQLDAISNNLANASTVGFKRVRADFQDLIYQNMQAPGTQNTATTMSPTGYQVGSGVRIVSTSRNFGQGALQMTNNPLDVAVEGQGFFVVQQSDGSLAFTRAGTLRADAQGRLVNAEGMPLDPPISFPSDATGITIGADGTVSASLAGQTAPVQLGQIQLAGFVNPAGLEAVGHNLLIASAASGEPQLGAAGSDGRGTLLQGAVEHSNVEVAEEMIGLIAAQRSYEVNSKVISAADEMLSNAVRVR
jgi:flagellar basal-body rod protein FlgG